MANIAVIGAQSIFRAGLASLLAAIGFKALQEADDIKQLKMRLTAQALLDILITRATRDPEDIRNLLQEVSSWRPNVKVIVLAGEIDLRLMQQCFAEGASGYLLETISPEALRNSLHLVKSGEKVFPSQLASLLPLIASQADKSASETAPSDGFGLSARERMILEGLIEGHTNKMIARNLLISEATVKIHVKHILRKLKVGNRTQAALWGAAKGVGRQLPSLAIAS
jgi:two-component system nitrate/nitrite response regulator NarL